MNKYVLEKAICTYGDESQMDMCIEEMSELIKAILKVRRYQTTHEGGYTNGLYLNMVEEIADVKIMLAQLEMMFSAKNDVDKYIDKKIERLRKRLEELL